MHKIRFFLKALPAMLGCCALLCTAGCGDSSAEKARKARKSSSNSATSGKPALPQIGDDAAGDSRSLGQNLIVDPSFEDLANYWQVKYSPPTPKSKAEAVEVELPTGMKVRALKLTTDKSAELTLKTPIPANPSMRYEYSVWVRQDPVAVGRRFFGPYVFGAKGERIGLFDAANVRRALHQHFVMFNYQDSMWRNFTGTILPADARKEDFVAPRREGQGVSLRFAPEAKAISLFFFNYYNEGRVVSTWIALPTIREISK
jgi:hypothetical protein